MSNVHVSGCSKSSMLQGLGQELTFACRNQDLLLARIDSLFKKTLAKSGETTKVALQNSSSKFLHLDAMGVKQDTPSTSLLITP